MADHGHVDFVQMLTVSLDSSNKDEPLLITDSRSIPYDVELSWATNDMRELLEGKPDGEYKVWVYAEVRWWREATMAGTEVESEEEIIDYIIEKYDPDDYEIQLTK